MTAKRDLKKRIRDRAARTGERYSAARRHVLGGGGGSGGTGGDGGNGVPFIELRDLSAAAARLGIRCRVHIFPGLAERVDTRGLLQRIRDVLRATERDSATDLLRGVILNGLLPDVSRDGMTTLLLHGTLTIAEASRRPFPPLAGEEFIARARAGIGGVGEGGLMLALPFAGKEGLEMVVCMLWLAPHMLHAVRPPSLVLLSPDDFRVSDDIATGEWRPR